MTDFRGNELNVGDKVIFTNGQFLGLHESVILKLTDRTVTVKHPYNWSWKPEVKILDPKSQVFKLA